MKSLDIKALVATTALALSGASVFAQVVKVDGSSTVYPVTEAVAEEFQKANKGTKVTVGVSGTGGGFKKFCRAETDISNASRPISKSEMDACRAAGVEYYELPVAFDALTVVINPKNAWLKQVDDFQLKAYPVQRYAGAQQIMEAMLAGPNADVPPVLGPAGIAHMSVLDFARWAGWNEDEYGPDSINHISVYRRPG